MNNYNADVIVATVKKSRVKSCKLKKVVLSVFLTSFFGVSVFGAYLRNVPITITQPNGVKIACFATGDEFYNWLHDTNGYTIIQDKITGYYCYAILSGDSLIASQYVVDTVSPASVNLQPYINISGEKIRKIANAHPLNTSARSVSQQSGGSRGGAITGTMNNIVIYVRFADDTEFPPQQSTYTDMFNSTSSGANSMRNYFNEATYGNLDIVSHFYPENDGTTILSYQYPQNRADAWVNFNDVINHVKNQIPTSLDVDCDNNGEVDNVCFIIREGEPIKYWPHTEWSYYSSGSYPSSINGKQVTHYNVQIEAGLLSPYSQGYTGGVSVLCHEMYHSFGSFWEHTPDLYHSKQDMIPVGDWDVMAHSKNPPQHMGAYMKYKYGGWISSIPEITTSGTYTLQPLTSPTNNCYKISVKGSLQYIVVEYRKKTGTFESSLPGSGLLVYRINEDMKGNISGSGYSGGVLDEVYIFRPNGKINPPDSKGETNDAYFSQTAGRTTFSDVTNPYGFTIPNGDYANICIKNIQENPNGTLSFDVRFCNDYITTHSNTNNLPDTTTTCGSIHTSGTVTVKSTDNVIFEAGNEVILDAGFEIELGGTFEINMNTDIINCCED